MQNFQVIDGHVTSAKGFEASGVYAGIKKANKDVALIYSTVPAVGAAVFTTNKVCAAPVTVSKAHVADGKVRAIVVNSGNANACTGQKGLEDATAMGELCGELLNIPSEEVIVSSTGVIGVQMPMDKILSGIAMAKAALGADGGLDAAAAIMTTDTKEKRIAVKLTVDGKEVTIGGIAKGSGMIHPNMATMLAFVTTDVAIDPVYLKKLLSEITDKTFNMITVDGDTSTNDMCVVLANGAAQNATLMEGSVDSEAFKAALFHVLEHLSKAIIRDGEGATKFIEVAVSGATGEKEARIAVKSILNSNLVKTAFFGEDGNWGRILCSLGYSGCEMNPDIVTVTLSSAVGAVQIVAGGQGTDYSEDDVAALLKETDIKVDVDLGIGDAKAVGWGCDLSYEYVKINGAYRT